MISINDSISSTSCSHFNSNSFNYINNFHSAISNDNDKDTTCGTTSLWRAVITQALMDVSSNSKRTEDKLAKQDALSWLTNSNEDLNIVCELADFSADSIRKKSKKAIENQCQWRLSPKSSHIIAKKKSNPIEKKKKYHNNINHSNIIKLSDEINSSPSFSYQIANKSHK